MKLVEEGKISLDDPIEQYLSAEWITEDIRLEKRRQKQPLRKQGDKMSKKILFDPGHGGKDQGASLGTRLEKTDNLKMALAIKTLLEEHTDIIVRLARATDVYKDLYARPKEALALNAYAFLSLHRNAYNGIAKGTEIWVRRYPNGKELEWADIIMGRLAAVGTSANRGVKKGQFVVLENTLEIPAIMIENLFIDNKSDNALFDKNFNAYAEAIAKGTTQFFREKWANNEAPKEYIKIQGGAFSMDNEKGARNALAVIHEAGRKYGIPELEDFWLVIPDNPDNVKDR